MLLRSDLMPAKKPAPKSAKGRKAASRPVAAKKAVVARKPPDERAKAVVPLRKSAAAPKKGAPHVPPEGIEVTTTTEEPIEMPKAARAPIEKPPHHSEPVVAVAAETPETGESLPLARDGADKLSADPTSEEDSDSMERESLLAGPRNVQPYIVKRGEQYMSKEQLEHFRLILHSWKRDLMVEVDRTVSHMKDEAANFPDPNDRATQEEEFSLELRTRDRERKLIRKIDEALKRIDDGSYGYCLETGEEIGIKRLEARPVATLSIEAQERRERRERQYGDRDDRYR
jgi:DnaK suppressor protein